MGKKIVNSIIFLAGLAAILVLTSHFLKPNDDVYNTNGVMAKKEEFRKETNDTIDVVFIGDSEVYSAYNPMQLYGNYGFTSYVLATSAQRLCDTYSILKSMYKTQTPEYIFIAYYIQSDVECRCPRAHAGADFGRNHRAGPPAVARRPKCPP